MNLIIDHARYQVFAICVDHLDVFIRADPGGDFLDALAFHKNIRLTNLAFVNQAGVGNEQSVQEDL